MMNGASIAEQQNRWNDNAKIKIIVLIIHMIFQDIGLALLTQFIKYYQQNIQIINLVLLMKLKKANKNRIKLL